MVPVVGEVLLVVLVRYLEGLSLWSMIKSPFDPNVLKWLDVLWWSYYFLNLNRTII